MDTAHIWIIPKGETVAAARMKHVPYFREMGFAEAMREAASIAARGVGEGSRIVVESPPPRPVMKAYRLDWRIGDAVALSATTVPASMKRKANPRRSPSRRANSATFRSFEHASMAARAYPSSTGWKTEARYPTKQSARLGAVDFAHKGRHQSGTIRIVEIREPRVEYVVKYKAKGAAIGKANPRRKAARSRNPLYGGERTSVIEHAYDQGVKDRKAGRKTEPGPRELARMANKLLRHITGWQERTEINKLYNMEYRRGFRGERGLAAMYRERRSSNPRTTSKQVGDWRQESKWDILQGKNKIGEVEYKGMVYQGRAWMPWGSYRGVSGKQTLEGMKRAVVAAYNRAWKGVGETVSGATRSAPRSSNPGRGSSNPHSFHDARVKVTRKGEVKIAIHNPSSAAAFLKVMGRRKNAGHIHRGPLTTTFSKLAVGEQFTWKDKNFSSWFGDEVMTKTGIAEYRTASGVRQQFLSGVGRPGSAKVKRI